MPKANVALPPPRSVQTSREGQAPRRLPAGQTRPTSANAEVAPAARRWYVLTVGTDSPGGLSLQRSCTDLWRHRRGRCPHRPVPTAFALRKPTTPPPRYADFRETECRSTIPTRFCISFLSHRRGGACPSRRSLYKPHGRMWASAPTMPPEVCTSKKSTRRVLFFAL